MKRLWLGALLAAMLPEPALGLPPRPLSSPRWCAGAAAFEGAPVVVGGRELDRYLDDVEYLDPVTKEWNRLRPLTRARACAGVAVTSQGIFVVGGEDQAGPTDAVELFDSRTREWRALPSLPVRLTRAGVAAHAGAVVVLGGLGTDGPSRAVWILRRGAKRWEALPPLPAPRWEFPAVGGSSGIRLVGGLEGDAARPASTARVDEYALSGTISALGVLPFPLSGAAAAVWRGRLVVAGGAGPDGKAASFFNSFDQASSSWTAICALQHPRRHLSLAAWSGGLLAAGGARDSSLGRTGYSFIDAEGGACGVSVEPNRDSHGVAYSGPDREERYAVAYPMAPARAHDLAVIVGIRRYVTLPHVPYADADAEAVAERFRALGFSTASIKVLIDSDAGFSDLSAALDGWLPKAARPDSRVYVYFSGHGAPSVGDGAAYLVPRDGDPEYLKSTAFPLDRLVARLGALRIAHAFVFLDSCFSGTGSRSVIAKGLRPLVAVRKRAVSGRVSVLSAAAGNQAAGSADARRHGLFTFHLLAGMGGAADANADGRVTLRELHEYLFRRVKDEAAAANRDQTPVLESASPDREI